MANKTEMPTINEIQLAMLNTISNKAMAEDAMMQNLFSKKNF